MEPMQSTYLMGWNMIFIGRIIFPLKIQEFIRMQNFQGIVFIWSQVVKLLNMHCISVPVNNNKIKISAKVKN